MKLTELKKRIPKVLRAEGVRAVIRKCSERFNEGADEAIKWERKRWEQIGYAQGWIDGRTALLEEQEHNHDGFDY